MMRFLGKNILLIGGMAAIGLAAWSYFSFFQADTAPLLSESDATSPISQELLVTLGNLRTIRLDETIFTDPVFLSLSDFGVVIPPEAIGKRNPFAPIGSSQTAPPATSTPPAASSATSSSQGASPAAGGAQ